MSPSPPVLEGTQEEWFPLASDPGFHSAGIEIGARATFKGDTEVPQLRIVFRRGNTETYVTCVHVAVYAGPLELLPSEAELARSSEHRKIILAPEEHYFALKSFVAGIAEVGLRTMFATALEAGDLSVGFNALMQAQFLQALFSIEPTATGDLCLWVIDNAAQSGGLSRKALDYLIPIKKLVAGINDTPVEILARLAGDSNKDVQDVAVANIAWKNCSPEILARLAGDADKDIRRAVALHKQTPPEVLANLADAPELTVRAGVACNERTPPDVLTRLARSCPICMILGEMMCVDYDEGMDFPEEMRRLRIVISFGYNDDLRRCPLCGTYFKFDFKTDNDIFSPLHIGEYKRITAEKAEQMVSEEEACIKARIKEQNQRYKREVRRKHGKVINTLPEVERNIVTFLTERLYGYTEVEDLQKNLEIEITTLENALAHLIQINVVSQNQSGTCVRYSIRKV